MALEKCPRCGAKVQPTDTVCMDCGLDLVEARKKIAAEAAQSAPTTTSQQQVAVANPAAAGVATDIGEDTRIREFDEQLAETLRAELPTAILTAIIGLGCAIGFGMTAAKLLMPAGGLRGLATLTPAHIRELGFGAFADQTFLGAMAFALSIAGLFAFIGQLHRAYTGYQAIQDVKFGGRPRVVGISTFTTIALVIASFILPPIGIVLGIIFKFSKDEDTRDLGGRMIWAGIIAIVLFLLNLLMGLAASLKSAKPAPKTVPQG